MITNFIPLIEATFSLNFATKNLVDIMNSDLVKSVKITDAKINNIENKHSARLVKFVQTMQTQVIGVVLKDFWLKNNFPSTSTLLYKIVFQITNTTNSIDWFKQ